MRLAGRRQDRRLSTPILKKADAGLVDFDELLLRARNLLRTIHDGVSRRRMQAGIFALDGRRVSGHRPEFRMISCGFFVATQLSRRRGSSSWETPSSRFTAFDGPSRGSFTVRRKVPVERTPVASERQLSPPARGSRLRERRIRRGGGARIRTARGQVGTTFEGAPLHRGVLYSAPQP